LREGDLALRDRELLFRRTGLALVQSRIGENQARLRFAQCGGVLVILLPARIVLRRQHRDPRELLLRQLEVGVGDPDILRRRIALWQPGIAWNTFNALPEKGRSSTPDFLVERRGLGR
jgi:hypothetical protein